MRMLFFVTILYPVLHFIKYNAIGIINTLITLAVVWVLHQWLDWNKEISNFLWSVLFIWVV